MYVCILVDLRSHEPPLLQLRFLYLDPRVNIAPFLAVLTPYPCLRCGPPSPHDKTGRQRLERRTTVDFNDHCWSPSCRSFLEPHVPPPPGPSSSRHRERHATPPLPPPTGEPYHYNRYNGPMPCVRAHSPSASGSLGHYQLYQTSDRQRSVKISARVTISAADDSPSHHLTISPSTLTTHHQRR